MITYTPNFIPRRIVVIGAGGTGSRVIPLISQFIKTCSWVIDPEIVVVDDDIVEEKNLFRQNFIKSDIGKNKAVVLANRYSKAYDINISAVTTRISRQNILETTKVLTSNDTVNSGVILDLSKVIDISTVVDTIFILCVDSPVARREIVSFLIDRIHSRRNNTSASRFNWLLIDSGNENDYGQVSISTGHVLSDYYSDFDLRVNALMEKLPSLYPIDIALKGLPINLSYFESMKEVSSGSCADLDQTMAINCLMANAIFSIIQNFYYVKPIPYLRLNIDLTHGVIPEYITLNTLKELFLDHHLHKIRDEDTRYAKWDSEIQFLPCNSLFISRLLVVDSIIDPLRDTVKDYEYLQKKLEKEKANRLKEEEARRVKAEEGKEVVETLVEKPKSRTKINPFASREISPSELKEVLSSTNTRTSSNFRTTAIPPLSPPTSFATLDSFSV